MKKTLIAIVATLMVGCSSIESQLPVGSTFLVPCNDHGSHVQTIRAARLEIMYDMTGDDGTSGSLAEEQLLQFLEMYGIVVDTTVVVR